MKALAPQRRVWLAPYQRGQVRKNVHSALRRLRRICCIPDRLGSAHRCLRVHKAAIVRQGPPPVAKERRRGYECTEEQAEHLRPLTIEMRAPSYHCRKGRQGNV